MDHYADTQYYTYYMPSMELIPSKSSKFWPWEGENIVRWIKLASNQPKKKVKHKYTTEEAK